MINQETLDFKVEWLNPDERHGADPDGYVKITGTTKDGRVDWETALQFPNYGRLMYALKDWFND